MVAGFLLFCLPIALRADDKVTRDSAGNIISTTATTASGTEIVRDSSGNVTGSREIHMNSDGTETVTIRDPSGKIVGSENRRQK
jgi:hypothetical protein